MSFLLTVKKVKPQLYCVARNSILTSMYKAWENCRQLGRIPEEPDFVASLVVNGTKELHDGWSAVFQPHNIKIAVTGIYCHETPKVSFVGMQKMSCELGDLLWCHIHKSKAGDVVRNAIMYQAKKSSRQPYYISPGDDQQRLYTTWPKFTYVSSGQLNHKKRHVKPATPRRGAQYLLIDSRQPEQPESGILGIPGTYPVGSCIAQNQLVAHSDLGLELVHSLELLSGDTFDERKVAGTGWSRVIWDLLSVTAKKAFKRAQSTYYDHPRASGASPSVMNGCFFITSQPRPYSETIVELLGKKKADRLFSSNKEVPPNNQEDEWFDEDSEGISVILVETYELEE